MSGLAIKTIISLAKPKVHNLLEERIAKKKVFKVMRSRFKKYSISQTLNVIKYIKKVNCGKLVSLTNSQIISLAKTSEEKKLKARSEALEKKKYEKAKKQN